MDSESSHESDHYGALLLLAVVPDHPIVYHAPLMQLVTPYSLLQGLSPSIQKKKIEEKRRK